MYSKKGVVYKVHAGWFINRTPGESINCGLFIKSKGLLCGNPTERGESLILNFWPARQFISPTQAPQLSATSEGLQDRKNTIHQIFTLSKGSKRNLVDQNASDLWFELGGS